MSTDHSGRPQEPRGGRQQPGHPQPEPRQPGSPQPGSARSGFPQPGQPQPGFPQQGYAAQPGYAQPGYAQPGYPQPPAPRKPRSKALLGCLGCGGVLAAVLVIGGIASVAGSGSHATSSGTAAPATSTGSTSASGAGTHVGSTPGTGKAAARHKSVVDVFRAYVKAHESARTREAAAHVTKIQGAAEQNGILDTADIYTDYTGGLAGPDAGSAKLLASAFADFQSSRGKSGENGLVTVYNAAGDILSNGTY